MRCTLERLRTHTNYKDITKERKYTHLQCRPKCLSFLVRADIFLLIHGNGYVFMEILQSLIIFDAIYSKTFSYNHEKRVLHDYKKKWYEKVSLKKGH